MKKKLFFLMVCLSSKIHASSLKEQTTKHDFSIPEPLIQYIFYKDKKPKAQDSLTLYVHASDLEKKHILYYLSEKIKQLAKIDLDMTKKALRRLLRLCIYDFGMDIKKSQMRQNISPLVIKRLKKVIDLYHSILKKPLSEKVFRKTKKDFTGSGMADMINTLVQKIEFEK